MKSKWGKILGILFLAVIYVILWWGLSWIVFVLDKSFNLKGPQFVELAVIVGFIFGALFTIFIQKLVRREPYIKEKVHKIIDNK